MTMPYNASLFSTTDYIKNTLRVCELTTEEIQKMNKLSAKLRVAKT